MKLNIAQMIDRVQNRIDRVKNPRVDIQQIVAALNDAQDRIINDRIDPLKEPSQFSFERAQVVMDQLSVLVKTSDPILPSAGIYLVPPDDYKNLIYWNVRVDGISNFSRPLLHFEEPKIYRNPFKSPKNKANKIFHLVESQGHRIISGSGTILQSGVLTYLREAKSIACGAQIVAGGGLQVGKNYYVFQDALIGNNSYLLGDVFTYTTGVFADGILFDATRVQNCELDGSLHVEICEIAAAIVSGMINDLNRNQLLEVQSKKQ